MKKPRVVPMAFLAIGLTLFQATARAQVVTTLAGSGASGSADGNGAEASFWNPSGLAVDSSGNVYVADTDNNKIRKLMPSGTVTTLAGSGNKGSADGKGASASFRFPRGIAVLVLRRRLGRGHPEDHSRRRGDDSGGGVGTGRDVRGRFDGRHLGGFVPGRRR